MKCPQCHEDLKDVLTDRGYMWKCASCSGRCMKISVAKRILGTESISELLRKLHHGEFETGRACPACGLPLEEVKVSISDNDIEIGVCRSCSNLCFDSNNYEKLPEIVETPKPKRHVQKREFPFETAKLIAEIRAREVAANPDVEYGEELPLKKEWSAIPKEIWKRKEFRAIGPGNYPRVTWILVISIIIINAIGLHYNIKPFKDLLFRPDNPFHYLGLPLLFSFFIHLNPFSLIISSYLLLSFGTCVESALDKKKYILLLISAGLLSHLTLMAITHKFLGFYMATCGSTVGVLIYYICRFQYLRHGLLLWIFLFIKRLRIPILVIMGLWWAIVLLFLGKVTLIIIHFQELFIFPLGGAAVGLAFYLWDRAQARRWA